MSKLVHFPNPHLVDAQATEWIARMDAGLSDQQESDLHGWLSAHASHPEALTRMATLWDDMAIMEELSTLFPLPRAQPSPLRWVGPMAAACGAAALLVTGAIWFAGRSSGIAPNESVALDQRQDHYETGIGEQSTATLPDGSSVTLNTNTSIDVFYSGTERRIVMNRGETLYQVMKDPSRPFNVHAAGHVVQAVGTAFDVRLKEKQVEVTVTKGVVKVLFAPKPGARAGSGDLQTPPREAILQIGDTATFVPHQFSTDAIRRLDPHDIEMRLSWREGMLYFDNEPLSNVLDEISRYTTSELVAGADIRDVRVGGYFKAGDIDGLLVALKKNFDIDAERSSGNRITLSRR